MIVNVVGLGYIGLPTALSIAAGGIKVVGVDKKPSVIESLKAGIVTFNEKGLKDLFDKATESENISFESQCCSADVYIVSVPTPYDKESKQIDAKYVLGAVEDVLSVCKEGAVIAIESTISPGTCEKYIKPLIKAYGKQLGVDLHIAHVPERIIPGNMLYELENNNRTIGVEDPKIADLLIEVYSSFCHGKMIVTDIKTAEMTKVIENTYRDVNIAFANELARICHENNLDVYEVIRIANMHPRVNILNPGPGVGGHCISVDPWFLVGEYPDLVNIIRQARIVNDGQPQYVMGRIDEIMKKHNILSWGDVGLYGLTYKEDVDDVRESPTLQLLELMSKQAIAGLKVYDPFIKEDIVLNQYHDFEKFIRDIKLLVIMVGHSEIVNAADKIEDLVVFDTRNCIEAVVVEKL